MKQMSISKRVTNIIKEIKSETIFGLKDFDKIGNPQAVVSVLSRLYRKGKIRKISKGKFFVPKKTRFGEVGPSEDQVLNAVVKESGGYFANGVALNRLGVTTQVPNEVVIRGARSTRKAEIGNLTVRYLRQGNPEASYKDEKLTDILEGIRLIKRIPDSGLELSLEIISSSIRSLQQAEKKKLVDLSLRERPYVRALLGAIIDSFGRSSEVKALKESLNSVTKYNLGIPERILPNKDRWGIT